MPRGRPVGSLGDEQRTLKAAILGAFAKLGGEDWLVEQAKLKPEAFLGILGKLVPRQIDADIGVTGPIELRWKGETPAA